MINDLLNDLLTAMNEAGKYINVHTVMTLTVALSSTLSRVSSSMCELILFDIAWFSMSSKFVSFSDVSDRLEKQ